MATKTLKAAARPVALPPRPTAAECVAVCEALASLHGRPSERRDTPRMGCEIQEPHTVLDSLVRTILSQNTTDVTSQRAFSSLKAAFPDWELVRTAEPGTVEAAIRVGGLADIKAARIKAILNSLLAQSGTLSLEHLRSLPCDEVKAQLTQFKGVGPKTVACVLMFCMGRAEFPVDTHVWEISKQLGWVPSAASREQTYEHLNGRVPDDIKYDLHVLMVQHGKVCPACGKRGTPQKRKAAAAAAATTACPLARFKRSKSSSNNAKADVTCKGDTSTQQDQHSAAAWELNDQTAAATAAASCKRLKRTDELSQSAEKVSMQSSLLEVAAVVSIKVKPASVEQDAGAEHKQTLIALGDQDTAATAASTTTGAAAAAAAAGLFKCEAEPTEEFIEQIKVEQSEDRDTACLYPAPHLVRVLRPRRR